MTEYIRTERDGKVVYRYTNADKDVPVYRWDLDEFINFCFFPIKSFIQVQVEQGGDDPSIDVLERLYGAAMVKIEKMAEILNRDLGPIQVVLTNHRTDEFMQETILGGEFQKEEKPDEVKPETSLDRIETTVEEIIQFIKNNPTMGKMQEAGGDQHANA